MTVAHVVGLSGGILCPICEKIFDIWSGHYMLSRGHYYHLVCLVRLMQTGSTCSLRNVSFPEALYILFGMPTYYKLRQQRASTPSVLHNLFDTEGGDNEVSQPVPPSA